MPKHSIILNSYNRPGYVVQSIRSIREQTSGDWEAFVADDGSTPETLEAIRKACSGDPRIRLLECAEPFAGKDRGTVLHRYAERINDALTLCSGEIQHYLADDDWYHPGRLAAFDALFLDASVMVGCGRMIYVDKDGKANGEERLPPGPTRQVQWNIDHNQCAHRRSILGKVGKWPIFPNDIALDACFFAEIAKHWDFVPIDRVVAYKRMHPFNLSKTRKFTTAERE